jgi:hypothetical protein
LADYWDNALLLINKNDHPLLVWGPSSFQTINHYKIYKAYTSNPSIPFEEFGVNQFDFWDETEVIITGAPQSNETVAYYKVNAEPPTDEESPVESYSTNIVNTRVKGEPPHKVSVEENRLYKFSLFQNYPNPFNPSTKIIYSLPELAKVTLTIYDILGREVVNLFSGSQEAGEYSVNFNAASLPSGIYFYKLTAGKFTEVRKMQLIK